MPVYYVKALAIISNFVTFCTIFKVTHFYSLVSFSIGRSVTVKDVGASIKQPFVWLTQKHPLSFHLGPIYTCDFALQF